MKEQNSQLYGILLKKLYNGQVLTYDELIKVVPIDQMYSFQLTDLYKITKSTEKISLDSTRAHIKEVSSSNIYLVMQLACNYLNVEYTQGLCHIAAICLHITNNILQALSLLVYLMEKFRKLWENNCKFSYQWCDAQTRRQQPKQKELIARIQAFPTFISLWTTYEAWSVNQRAQYLEFLMILGTNIHYEFSEYAYHQRVIKQDKFSISFQQFLLDYQYQK